MKKQNQSFLDDWGVTIDEGFDKNDIDSDFRNALKGKIMRYGIPIQIIRESTLNSILEFNDITKTTQEPSAFAWNFSMGLYYKSNGKPWRLAKLRQDTCYVGISFYHNLLNPNNDIQTSMAQVFTHNGEGIVLRGSDVIIDLHKEPHLSEEQSRDLLSKALDTYIQRSGNKPKKIVIHKTSLFSNEENKGFNSVIGNLEKDFVTINRRTSLRFSRIGTYPVLRGTMISLSTNKCLFVHFRIYSKNKNVSRTLYSRAAFCYT